MTDNTHQPQDEKTPATGQTVRLPQPDTTNQAADPNGWNQLGEDWREVGEEFKQLGTRLGNAIRQGWTSTEAQQFNSLGDQLRSMTEQVEGAIRAAQQEAASPETKAQAQRAVAAAKEAQTSLVDEVRDTVAAALRTLNIQLHDLADKIEQGRK